MDMLRSALATRLGRQISVTILIAIGVVLIAVLGLSALTPAHDSGSRVAIFAADGRLVHAQSPVHPDVLDTLARLVREAPQGSTLLSWSANGQAWTGTTAPLLAANGVGFEGTLVSFAPTAPAVDPFLAALRMLPLVLLLALLGAAFAAAIIVRRYEPPLRRVVQALDALREGRALPVPRTDVEGVADLVESCNAASVEVTERLLALENLNEIDRMLLASADLEQMLEVVLSRVQVVMRCHSVGITLIDSDTNTHGRMYLATSISRDLPVNRIPLDGDMLATLLQGAEGLTVARCEPGRHSFLEPLEQMGASFYWIWPVICEQRLVAVLAVGYREAPSADPQLVRYGSEFASRLAIALSNSARDEHLYRQAHYDPLTSLPNRLLFRDKLAQDLAATTVGGSRGALMYIDLDQFKRVNDTVGHGAGDQLLTIVAQRLRACVKDGDSIARLGGDEFTVILRQVSDPEAVRAVADRIIAAVEKPVHIADRDHFVRASIGITMFPDDGGSIDELMRHADVAMYRAKDLGRGRAVFFDRTLMATANATQSGLYRALRHREFALYYQPLFSVATGELVGLEALLRWNSPRNGMRSPAEFVPAAEETGLIVDIGGWVIDAACAQLALWRDQGLSPPKVSINVSMQQLRQPRFAAELRRVLARYGLPAEMLTVEFVESTLADTSVSAVLAELTSNGISLALDDFGTGHSSLSALRSQPIDVVKIDRSFLEDATPGAASSSVIETIIAMAHTLGKTVVAEGVETSEQLDFLRERGCDVAQGFFLARPLPVSSVTELLAGRLAVSGVEQSRLTG